MSRALAIVRDALEATGIDLAASCPIAAYDARAPEALRSAALMPRARGVIVVGSAGGALWSAFTADANASPSASPDAPPERWEAPHPLDGYVARMLDRADLALARAGIGARRFEPTLYAQPALSFRALGEIVGLGSMGPFGLLIHESHGPWWALRGAWLVDTDVDRALPHAPPCAGCAAPCIAGAPSQSGIVLATAEVRTRCIVGAASRYSDAQLAYHYDHDATLARLRRGNAMRDPENGNGGVEGFEGPE